MLTDHAGDPAVAGEPVYAEPHDGSSAREPAAWKKAAAGASAGVLCCAVFAPLDVARTRLQVQTVVCQRRLYSGVVGSLRQILADEGIAGWFRGFVPAMLTVPLFWCCYFPLYDSMKRSISASFNLPHTDPSVHVASSTAAGGLVNLVTNPLWVIRTRLQTQAIHADRRGAFSMSAVARSIWAREGPLALYKGLGASMLGLSHIAVQFPVYEWTKRTLHELTAPPPARRYPPGSRLARSSVAVAERHDMWSILCASALSKLLASTLTYPHELIRARLQDQAEPAAGGGAGGGAGRAPPFRGIVDVVVQTVRREGILGLWQGYSINLVRTVPQSMLTFGVYEWIVWRL